MRIPDYPAPAAPLDGTEIVPLWEAGQQRSQVLSGLWNLPNGAVFSFSDSNGPQAKWTIVGGELTLLIKDPTNYWWAILQIPLETPQANVFFNINSYLNVEGLIHHSSFVSTASLPSAATYPASRWFVNDANATTFGTIVVGGGTNMVPVYSDGTNWRIG